MIEFARGGPDGATVPLPTPYGYGYSLAQLSPEIADRSSILFVWVTPEESRRRNEERARPGRDGDASILHHGVPEAVMFGDYGEEQKDIFYDHLKGYRELELRRAVNVLIDGSKFRPKVADIIDAIDRYAPRIP